MGGHLAAESFEGRDGGADVGALGIVVPGDAVEFGNALDAVRQALEFTQCRQLRRQGQANGTAQGQRGKGVGDIVQAAQRQLVAAHQAFPALHQPPLGQAEIRGIGRRVKAECQPAPAGARHLHDAHVLAVEHLHAAAGEDARLGRGIVVHPGIAVEVVVRDVEHCRRIGLQAYCRLQLEARQFQHPDIRQLARIEAGHQGGQRSRANVAGHRRHLAGGAAQRARHRRRGGLAVGAGDGDHPAGFAQAVFAQGAGEQLDLADDGNAAPGGCGHHRLVERKPRRETQHLDASQQFLVERSGQQFRARRAALQFGGMRRLAARIGHAHAGTQARQPLRHGQARLAEPEHQNRFALQCHLSFSVDKPNSTSMIVMIQNLTTTWVSFQPFNS